MVVREWWLASDSKSYPGKELDIISIGSSPVKHGSLDGSTQHSGRTRLALKTKAKSLARARSAGALPWLGFDRVPPKKVGSPGEVLWDQLIRWCCVDRLSWQR